MSNAQSYNPQPSHPSPFIIPPSGPHTHTIVLLHGLSTTGVTFGTPFLRTGLNSHSQTLPETYPYVKFIFPTGAARKCTAFNNTEMHVWFDISTIADRTVDEHLQIEGLSESTGYLMGLIREEIEVLEGRGYGAENLVLWGFSQGCAMGMWVLLRGGVKLGGFVGMSGWMPFRRQIEEVVKGSNERAGRRLRALEYMNATAPTSNGAGVSTARVLQGFETPVFLGHGMLDLKVRTEWGVQMRELLGSLEMGVGWKEYEGLEHWYMVPDEIDDIEDFLRKRGFHAST